MTETTKKGRRKEYEKKLNNKRLIKIAMIQYVPYGTVVCITTTYSSALSAGNGIT